MPSFQEISCDQQWPGYYLDGASAGLVSYNNSKEIMLCGGYDIDDHDYGVMTGGCYIWSEQGWIQSDTTFNR